MTDKPLLERKRLTVMFCDLSGYSALAERLDPETVREITTRLLGEIAAIVEENEGTVGKFAGDAIMAVFGYPRVQEDDAVRAVHAAIETHRRVAALSVELFGPGDTQLRLHTGINTGLVVAADADLGPGIHGLVGDAVNVAARLSELAAPDEVLAGEESVRHAARAFVFEPTPPLRLKGKKEQVKAFRLVGGRDTPYLVHRATGLRAPLTGRETEMATLLDAVNRTCRGESGIVEIAGDAGTGKSRLIEELRLRTSDLDLAWVVGCAYPYTQKAPLGLIVDALRRTWRIRDSDTPESVERRVDEGARILTGELAELQPYLRSLFDLPAPDLENLAPEYWNQRLGDAVHALIVETARRRPTIVCLEDLHWADAASIALLNSIAAKTAGRMLFICTYRNASAALSLSAVSNRTHVALRDLAPHHASQLARSLLDTDTLPAGLGEFINDRLEGNPFYLEESLNRLIETGHLKKENGGWKFSPDATGLDLPTTVHEVIAARIDQLRPTSKAILREAAVIGRIFSVRILRGVTDHPESLIESLEEVQRLDIIRTHGSETGDEYRFKHPLIQEVLYNTFLKAEKLEIHERVGRLIETLHEDRRIEFSEVLAHHFRHGRSTDKAVQYLCASGDRSSRRYAIDAADQYFRDAYGLLKTAPGAGNTERASLVIDVLLRWSGVINHRGAYPELIELLESNASLLDEVMDPTRRALFEGLWGYGLQCRGQLREAYGKLHSALRLAKQAGSDNAIAYISAWLTRTCSDMGRLGEAIAHGEQAVYHVRRLAPDHALFRFTYAHLGLAHYFCGDRASTERVARECEAFGNRYSDVRSRVLAHVNYGNAHLIDGDVSQAVSEFETAVQLAVDPMYEAYARLMLGYGQLSAGEYRAAELTLRTLLAVGWDDGFEMVGTTAEGLLAATLLLGGSLSKGLRLAEKVAAAHYRNESFYRYVLQEHAIAKVYLRFVLRTESANRHFSLRELPFVLTNLVTASRKAMSHLMAAIEVAESIGARAILGQCYLDLSSLQDQRGDREEATSAARKAMREFKICGSSINLERTRQQLQMLEARSREAGKRSGTSAR